MGLLRPPSLQELKEVGKGQPRLEAEHPADTRRTATLSCCPVSMAGRGVQAGARPGGGAACARPECAAFSVCR